MSTPKSTGRKLGGAGAMAQQPAAVTAAVCTALPLPGVLDAFPLWTDAPDKDKELTGACYITQEHNAALHLPVYHLMVLCCWLGCSADSLPAMPTQELPEFYLRTERAHEHAACTRARAPLYSNTHRQV